MSEKLAQPTPVLVKRLRRVAKYLDKLCDGFPPGEGAIGGPAGRAYANTCWQVAARLEELDAPRAGHEQYTRSAEGRFKSKPEEYGPRDRAILGGDPSL